MTEPETLKGFRAYKKKRDDEHGTQKKVEKRKPKDKNSPVVLNTSLLSFYNTMAKPQPDQTWPYGPPVSFYSRQMYNTPCQPYQQAPICQESCCQQPQISRTYRPVPYHPPLGFSQSNSYPRQASQPLAPYAPVNPYNTSESCSRQSIVHRPIPQNKFNYDHQYRVSKGNNSFKNDLGFIPTNPQYPSTQYRHTCNHYPAETSSPLPNIDVRQFLSTWQEKEDDDVVPSEQLRASGYNTNVNPNSHEPLDCTKRNEHILHNTEYTKAHSSTAYYNKHDASTLNPLNPTAYLQSYINNSVISNPEDMGGHPRPFGQLTDKDTSFVPFERSIEKITNPRIYKSQPSTSHISKPALVEYAMIDEACPANTKEFKNNSQYHLSASLESDDMFDDINRKKEEKQKNIVHPLCHEETHHNNILTDSNEKIDLFHIARPCANAPVPSCNIPSVPYNLTDNFQDSLIRFNDDNQLSNCNEDISKRNSPKDNLDFNTKIPHDPPKDLEYETCDDDIPAKKFKIMNSEENIVEEGVTTDLNSNFEDSQITPVHDIKSILKDCNLEPCLMSDDKKNDTVNPTNLEVSSDDIELSLSSGDSLIDDVNININDLDSSFKLPNEVTSKETADCSHITKVNEFDANSIIKEHKNDVDSDFNVNAIVNDGVDDAVNTDNQDNEDEEKDNTKDMIDGTEIEKVSPMINESSRDLNKNINMQNVLNNQRFDSTSPSLHCSYESKTKDSNNVTNALQEIAYYYQDILSENSNDSEPAAISTAENECISASKEVKIRKHNLTSINNKKYKLKNIRLPMKSSRGQLNAFIGWKIKNRLLTKRKLTVNRLKSKAKKKSLKNNKIVQKSTANILENMPRAETLDILTECSNTNCEVNCVIYEADSHSCKKNKADSILADEVQLSGKFHGSINNNCTSVKTYEVKQTIRTTEIIECSSTQVKMPTMITETDTCKESLSNKTRNIQLRNVIADFFSGGKLKIDSDLSCSFEEPELVKQILIKGGEEVGSPKWHFKNIKTTAQRESIKCSLTWEKIFKSLYEKNEAFKRDSLELGPARIHLTLSPKNQVQGKSNAKLNVFKAVINARKLILKRNDLFEERIPKMVIKKSEGQGYTSFIKDATTCKKELENNNIPLSKDIEVSNKTEPSNNKALKSKTEETTYHHCLLCQKSFMSIEEFNNHEASKTHRHLDIIQRSAVHHVYNSIYGCDHPHCQPLSTDDKKFLEWKPSNPGFNNNYHNALP